MNEIKLGVPRACPKCYAPYQGIHQCLTPLPVATPTPSLGGTMTEEEVIEIAVSLTPDWKGVPGGSSVLKSQGIIVGLTVRDEMTKRNAEEVRVAFEGGARAMKNWVDGDSNADAFFDDRQYDPEGDEEPSVIPAFTAYLAQRKENTDG